MKDRFEDALNLMVDVKETEIATDVTITATIEFEFDNTEGAATPILAEQVRGRLDGLPITRFGVKAQRPATFDEKLAFLATGGRDSCNGHMLETIRERVKVPCWRIEYLAGLREQAPDDKSLADWQQVHNTDFPNGLEHDGTCRTCHGSNVQIENKVVGYKCGLCEMQHDDRSGFYPTCCILEYGITKGIIEEWVMEHDDGEHDPYRKPGCPRCATENMHRKSEARKVNA